MSGSGNLVLLEPFRKCAGASTSRLSAFSEIGKSGRELSMAEISYARVLNSSMAKMDAPTTL